MDWLTTQAPLWATGLLVLGAFASGRLFRRDRLAKWRQRAQAAERQARYATRRAETAEQSAEAVTRALPAEAWPEPVMETLTTRGGPDATAVNADFPAPALDPPDDLDRFLAEELRDPEFRAAYERRQQIDRETRALSPAAAAEVRADTAALVADLRHTDELVAASSLGTPEAVEARRSVSPAGELTGMGPEQADWDAAYDVFPDDDEPEQPEERRKPGPPSDSPTVTFAAVLPRYDWSAAGWSPGLPVTVLPPPSVGVPPRGYGWLGRATAGLLAPLRLVRWTLAGWSWRAAARAEAREVDQAAHLLGYDGPGATDEATGPLPVVGHAPVPKPQPPRSYLPLHVWRRRMVSVAALLDGHLPPGPAGRHRVEVACGALGQRPQRRQFALPAGAR